MICATLCFLIFETLNFGLHHVQRADSDSASNFDPVVSSLRRVSYSPLAFACADAADNQTRYDMSPLLRCNISRYVQILAHTI
jgi:hypothetical protein